MTELTIDVYTSPSFELANGGLFSPTTSTLVLGPTEALLVDTQYLPEHVEEVRRRIEASGRTLTTIFITHAHYDHFFGLETLLKSFPGAKAIATVAVASAAAAELEESRETSRDMFSGAALDTTVVPAAFEGDSFTIDGEEVRIVELPQADIHPTAALHIPSIGAVIAGDAIYNGVNPFLAVSTVDEWPRWVESTDIIAALEPKLVVAGHKRPELPDDPKAIAETKAYLTAFIEGHDHFDSTRDLVNHMQAKFPDHDNPSALLLSAALAMKAKKRLNHG
ncbi:MBL fold metallo-hydrolase [Aeromicrobium sp. HA]|uniref:MBL fold metallo-hydrolase n=1 Tax=Aeromicrobium sp. HA TaxID=3009077 RepID=UPI0022AF3C03|nr:MBL fold metallo-hydrolase [Aeromicrobium sp. HA]